MDGTASCRDTTDQGIDFEDDGLGEIPSNVPEGNFDLTFKERDIAGCIKKIKDTVNFYLPKGQTGPLEEK